MISQQSALAMLQACDECRVALQKMRDVEYGLNMTNVKQRKFQTPYLRTIDALLASLQSATDAARQDMAVDAGSGAK